MKLISQSFDHNGVIPQRYAMGRHDPETHATFADNVSPHLQWTDAPADTQSFALICVDPDAPSVADDVNQEGKTVSADLPRANFYHWAMVDIPANVFVLKEGECGNGVVTGGKTAEAAAKLGPEGARQGINSYTDWFAGDDDMEGDYYGYDGPFPPWNDEIIHHYHFRLLALDVASLSVEGRFNAEDVLAAAEGHILAESTFTGTYRTNLDAELQR